MPTSSFGPQVSSNGVNTHSGTRANDLLERHKQVLTPVPPLASARSSQGRKPPDVAHVPPTKLTDASVNVALL
jgi:hypothetical protein